MIRHFKTLLFIICCLLALTTKAQTNLVPNPSFEIYDTCPTSAGTPPNQQILYAVPWFAPTDGSPDYYNSCAPASSYASVPVTWVGNSYAHTGVGMAGIILMDGEFSSGSFIYREYIMVRLQNLLINHQKYYLTYYVKLADSAIHASNNISVFFGDSIYRHLHDTAYDTLNVTPQITNPTTNFITSKTTWSKLSGSFIANGTEKFMCIGNFKEPVTNDTIAVAGGSSNN